MKFHQPNCVFFICYRAHTDLYRVYTGSCPAWYRTLRPRIVLACRSQRVLTVCIPPPLKYVMLLWNIYYCSEIYILPLWNMYCRSEILLLHHNIYCHSAICYPDGMHTFANHHYAVKYGHRPTNGSITASYRPPSSYRAHTGFSPCATACIHPAKCFEYVQNFRRPLTGHWRVHRSLNAPPCALTVFHRPHEIYHTVAHGRLSRCHVTATLLKAYKAATIVLFFSHPLFIVGLCILHCQMSADFFAESSFNIRCSIMKIYIVQNPLDMTLLQIVHTSLLTWSRTISTSTSQKLPVGFNI